MIIPMKCLLLLQHSCICRRHIWVTKTETLHVLNIFIKGSIFDGNNFVTLHIPEGKKERKKEIKKSQ